MAGRMKIVAVDDAGVILKKLEKIFKDRYDFKGFNAGNRAMGFLKETKADLIILDVEMPDINGYDLLKKIRRMDGYSDVPVIFLTSNADKKHVVKAIADGVNDYVVKPIDEEILVKKINLLLYDN